MFECFFAESSVLDCRSWIMQVTFNYNIAHVIITRIYVPKNNTCSSDSILYLLGIEYQNGKIIHVFTTPMIHAKISIEDKEYVVNHV